MIRKSICCVLGGLLIPGSFTAFAHAYVTDWAGTPSIVRRSRLSRALSALSGCMTNCWAYGGATSKTRGSRYTARHYLGRRPPLMRSNSAISSRPSMKRAR